MSKRRLLTLFNALFLILALLLTVSVQAEQEIEIQDESPAKAGAPCPCLTPTATPTATCPCSTPAQQPTCFPTPPAKSAAGPAAKADEEITIEDEPAPGAKVSKPALGSSKGDDEISIENGPAVQAAAKPLPTAPPLPMAEAKAKAASQSTSPVKSAPTAAPKTASSQTVAHVSPTPDNSQWIQEDRTLKENDLRTQLGQLDKPLFRATLDGLYSKAFSTDASNRGFSNGFGGDLRVEVQFYKPLSLGLYYDFALFSVPGANVLTGPMGIFFRIIPVHNGGLEGYIIGGAGINSLVSSNDPVRYPTDFNAFGGLGLTQSFGDHWGLDVNVVYNYYSPGTDPLNTVSARLGITYAVDLEDFMRSLSGGKNPKSL